MLALLLARRGVRATLLETHRDFDRDFRGEAGRFESRVLPGLSIDPAWLWADPLAERGRPAPDGPGRRALTHRPGPLGPSAHMRRPEGRR
jgi:hypothetical protein